MAIKVKDLIKKLKEKDQNAEVEFIVVKTDGGIICMDVKTKATGMVDILKMFNN